MMSLTRMPSSRMRGCFAARRSRVWVLALACAVTGNGFALAQASGGTGQVGAPATSPSTSLPGIAPVQAATSSTTPLPMQSSLYPGEDFLIGPGDLISVRVFLQPDYQPTLRVGLDGSAELPFIGSVHLQGLTVRAAQNLIAERLRTGGFYRNPEVTLMVLESLNGSVTISGEVKAVIPVTGARRLIDVLSAAGGLPAAASHTVRIVRPGPNGEEKTIEVNLGADLTNSAQAGMLVYPRDIIQIARAGVVYVLGAFTRQGAVPLDQATPLTLLQLAALSGGINFEGKYQDLRIIRTIDNKRTVVQVDIKKIREGKESDPILQTNDIVFLPTNDMKAVLKNLGVGGVLGMVSLLYSIRNF